MSLTHYLMGVCTVLAVLALSAWHEHKTVVLAGDIFAYGMTIMFLGLATGYFIGLVG